jgi:hypothetical protein
MIFMLYHFEESEVLMTMIMISGQRDSKLSSNFGITRGRCWHEGIAVLETRLRRTFLVSLWIHSKFVESNVIFVE